jgi:hypothetical protein
VLAGNDLWLCGSTLQPAKLDFSNPAVAYAARQSAKNILYTYIDTNLEATSITVNEEAHSELFSALWITLNVVLGAGIGLCVIFAVIPPYKDKGKKVK